MAVIMVAIKEFDGLEGFKKPGDNFKVTRQDRAEALEAAGLAEFAKVKIDKKKEKAAN